MEVSKQAVRHSVIPALWGGTHNRHNQHRQLIMRMIIIRQWNSFKTNFKDVQMTSQEYYMYVVCTASIPEAEARSSACAEVHSYLWRPASPHHDWGDSSVGRKCWDQHHQTMEHSSCSHTDQPVTHVQKHWFKKLKKESNRYEWVHNQRNSAKRALKSQHFSC